MLKGYDKIAIFDQYLALFQKRPKMTAVSSYCGTPTGTRRAIVTI